MNNTTPKLSVLVVTYNQEEYIHQALDSVIMQKTDFDFEIVVADDCSTDATLAILEEYRIVNSNIRILPSDRNVGITRNYQRGFAACRGQYVAVLDGDDFWTSPNKLKLVSTFLDQHQDFTFCFHRVIRHDEASDRVGIYPKFETTPDALTASDLARGNFIGGFSTCVYRREAIERLDPALYEMKVYGDWPFNIAIGEQGKIGYLAEIMSVYRAHVGGLSSGKTEDENRAEILGVLDAYNNYLNFKFDAEFEAYKLALLTQTQVPMGAPLKPRVSVLVVTYNHEKYVRQALDSVLMQQTDFDIEIIIADDSSTDSTPSIIKEYRNGHLNIRVLPNDEDKIGITRNYQRGFAACRGEYVAVLEGDDFWTSPNKLKLVSTLLDEHQDYSFCFHRLIRHDEASDRVAIYPKFESRPDVFTASDLARGNFVGGLSTCTYRRKVIDDLPPELWKMKVREWPFNIVVATHGPVGYIPEILSVYRAHTGGISSRKTLEELRPILLELIDSYNKYLNFKFDTEFREFRQALLLAAPSKHRRLYRRLRLWLAPILPIRLKHELKSMFVDDANQ